MDLSSLVEVLTHGEEQLRQLEACLDVHSPVEHKKQLVLQAQSYFKRAISMAKSIDPERFRQGPGASAAALYSPRSNSGGSDNSDKALKEQERREMCKKRKTLPKWTSQIRISSSEGVDALDDGHTWRKYGQKEILGAKYPRCTHRNTVGCLAMKQVQRSDDDPSVFDITYRGEHTCPQKPRTVATSALHQPDIHQSQQRPRQDQQLLLSFQTSLKVKTEGSSFEDTDQNSPFSFPSTPMSTLSTPFSAAFTSPATSESKYFGDAPPLHMTESDLTDIIYATTSAATSSSTMDISFMLDSVGFDPAFHFDASSFLHNF
ncbi:hypothetical protein B296_00031490 [Ensete ventricosum]|uniref:WRKY domain-containing protein n=1 Tax=Ensete ventricosum TaxID=4639 RepID=A0A427A5N6_ENSVE|nr:hypothetical protein B296_00031490 [Ensete ventricosum]